MERRAFRVSGFVMLGVLVVLAAAAVVAAAVLPDGLAAGLVIVLALAWMVISTGFTGVHPNEARVLQYFGRYVGTITEAGLHWTVPLSAKRRLSRRVRNFETDRLK